MNSLKTMTLAAVSPLLFLLSPTEARAQFFAPRYSYSGPTYVAPQSAAGYWSDSQYRDARRIVERIRDHMHPIQADVNRIRDPELTALANQIQAEAETLVTLLRQRSPLDAVEARYRSFSQLWASLAGSVQGDRSLMRRIGEVDQLDRSLAGLLAQRTPAYTTYRPEYIVPEPRVYEPRVYDPPVDREEYYAPRPRVEINLPRFRIAF